MARNASDRRASGELLLEGPKIIRMAMESGVELTALFVRPDADPRLVADASRLGCPIRHVDEDSMAKISTTTTPQPEMALGRRPVHLMAAVVGDPVVVAVDIQDPGNAGTLVRSALSAGASGVVFCGESVDPFSPKTVRASAGAVFGLPVVEVADTGTVLTALRSRGLHLHATDSTGSSNLFESDLRQPSAIVVGNEANGLGPEVVGLCDSVMAIPMAAGESLNVGVAASIVLFEAMRQRQADA